MVDLDALVIFAKVVEANGFSAAARRLGMPVSTVSRRIADLEDRLGVRLLERSTRSLRLTDIGAEILQQAQRAAELGEAVASILSNQLSEVKGVLRLSAPPSISDSLLVPILNGFQAAYPDVQLRVMVTDRFVDHIEEGIDIAFRVGPLKDSALIARPLMQYRPRLLASPAYLEDHLPPARPADLHGHRLIAFSFWQPQTRWTLRRGTEEETVSFQPDLAINDYAGIAAALAGGRGIGALPPIVAPRLVETGRLVEVMADWRFAPSELSLVYVSNRHLPRHVRLFKDFAATMAPTLFADLPV